MSTNDVGRKQTVAVQQCLSVIFEAKTTCHAFLPHGRRTSNNSKRHKEGESNEWKPVNCTNNRNSSKLGTSLKKRGKCIEFDVQRFSFNYYYSFLSFLFFLLLLFLTLLLKRIYSFCFSVGVQVTPFPHVVVNQYNTTGVDFEEGTRWKNETK